MDRIMTMDDRIVELEKSLGRHVRSRRITADLSQVELSARANVSLGAVKNLEAGRGSSVHTLLKVIRALGAEEWLDLLDPPAAPPRFNPLDVLAAQQAIGRTREAAPRVRRRPKRAP